MQTEFELAELGTFALASPCTRPWDSMKGTDSVRHCGDCNLNVYNARAMSTDEVRALLQTNEGRVCMRFYVRPDGTLLTRDCERGFAALRSFVRARTQEELRRHILLGHSGRLPRRRKVLIAASVLLACAVGWLSNWTSLLPAALRARLPAALQGPSYTTGDISPRSAERATQRTWSGNEDD